MNAAPPPRVVCAVGESGSPSAVAYAAGRAAAVGLELHLATVVGGPPIDLLDDAARPVRRAAQQRLLVAAARATALHPDLRPTVEVVEDTWAAGGLARAARPTDVLVLEQTDRSSFERLVTGSTVAGLGRRASGPFVVIPHDWSDHPDRPAVITIAAQDAGEAQALLPVAAAEARRQGAEVVVLHVASQVTGLDADVGLTADWTDRARRELTTVVEEFSGHLPGTTVRVEVVVGHPATVVLEAAARSHCLILGRRHHERPWGSHLGPVVRRATLDAACPVLVAAESRPEPARARHAAPPAPSPLSAPVQNTDQPQAGDVVVAVDRGDLSGVLRYATAEAGRRGVGLHLVHVVHAPSMVEGVDPAEVWANASRGGRELLAVADAQAKDLATSDLTITQHVLERGTTVGALVDATEAAALVVMMHRGLSPLWRVVTRSVVGGVAARTHVPVVSVPEDWAPGAAQAPVVVGVQEPGSRPGVLRTAFAEAARRAVPLRVVHAMWYAGSIDVVAVDRRLGDEWATRAHAALERTLSTLRPTHPEVDVDIVVRHQPPTQLLAEVADVADLVVLGRRRVSRPWGTHLGPVTRALLDASSCPVMVADEDLTLDAVVKPGSQLEE